MRLTHWKALLTLALTGALLSPLPAADPVPEPNWLALVGTYPQPGTPDAMEDLGALVWLRQSRTQADLDRAKSELKPNLGCFASVLNPSFEPSTYPMTEALLAQAKDELTPLVGALQDTFLRPRPYVDFPNLDPAIPAPTTTSYPSAHAAVGVLFANILVQLAPGQREAVLERGNLLGSDRVTLGVHWPSDVAAGQRLGKAFATYWISQPQNADLIRQVCGAEWHQSQRPSAPTR